MERVIRTTPNKLNYYLLLISISEEWFFKYKKLTTCYTLDIFFSSTRPSFSTTKHYSPSDTHVKQLNNLRTPLPQFSSLHPLQPLTRTSLNNLPLLKILRIFKVTFVTEVHEMSGLVHLTLETTEGGFDGFTFPELDCDSGLTIEGGG